MEKEVVWTAVALKDFWNTVSFLQDNWTEEVLQAFQHKLQLKIQLLQKQPYIGFKSAKYSRFRHTLIAKHYKLIYLITKDHIVIHKLNHTAMR